MNTTTDVLDEIRRREADAERAERERLVASVRDLQDAINKRRL